MCAGPLGTNCSQFQRGNTCPLIALPRLRLLPGISSQGVSSLGEEPRRRPSTGFKEAGSPVQGEDLQRGGKDRDQLGDTLVYSGPQFSECGLETLRSLRYFGCSLHGHLLELKLSNNEDRLCQQTSLVIIFTTIYLQENKGKFALKRPG